MTLRQALTKGESVNYQQPYQPQDQPPQGYHPAPGYPQQPPYMPQPPVVVNVTQNAGRPIVLRRPLNNKLHAWLTLLTGGAWLCVWIPLAIKRRKAIVYR